MSLWLVRTGKHGEHEAKFLADNRVYITWDRLDKDLSKLQERDQVFDYMQPLYGEQSVNTVRNWAAQIWSAVHRMQHGDWIVVPSKHKPVLNIAEVISDCQFDPDAGDGYRLYREVKWVARDLPRSIFEQDLLYSFGAFLTICRIQRNDAEKRVRAMAKANWKPPSVAPVSDVDDLEESGGAVDIEQLGRDEIARLISRRFTGHGLATLVGALLDAQGYTTFVSPPGSDKGVDILAAPGALGFGQPRLCVQVKSGDTPVDAPTLNQLIGAMQTVNADQGLLVSWAGFKASVDKETPAQFFRVRLWDQNDLVEQLLEHYDKINPDIRAELPLKNIWTVSQTSGDDSET